MCEKVRCPWAGTDPLYRSYHDLEWGVPVGDDRKLFEFLILEGAQAGLSWITILKKRENYRRGFAEFDPEKVAAFTETEIAALLTDPGLIRNRRKVEAAARNARAFLAVAEEYGSFAAYIWQFVDGAPRQNAWPSLSDVPIYTPEAEAMSRELRRKGFIFVGPTICYSFMQAVGMVNDHLIECFRHEEVQRLTGNFDSQKVKFTI
jgi:DNA-3-methyladenine glycosylase I